MTFNINLPSDMDIEDIKELIDYLYSKERKERVFNTAALVGVVPTVVGGQYAAESFGISPPIIHFMLEAFAKMADVTKEVSGIVKPAWEKAWARTGLGRMIKGFN